MKATLFVRMIAALVLASAGCSAGDTVYVLRDLGRIAGADTLATSVNDAGMSCLPVPDGCLNSYAYSINEAGLVVGQARYEDGYHAVAWEPVPEPTSVIPLVFGVLSAASTALCRRFVK